MINYQVMIQSNRVISLILISCYFQMIQIMKYQFIFSKKAPHFEEIDSTSMESKLRNKNTPKDIIIDAVSYGTTLEGWKFFYIR